MQKSQTIKIPNTRHQRTFKYTSTAQLEGKINQWIESLIDKGQLSETQSYQPKRVIIGGAKKL